jgi:cytochrome P450
VEVAREQGALAAFPSGLLESLQQLTSYEDVTFVLRSKDFGIASTIPEYGGRYWNRLLGGTLSSLDLDDHFERRRLESVLFRREMLRYYETELVGPALHEALGALADQRGEDGLVRADLVRLLKTMLFRLMAALTGLDGVEDDGSVARMEELFDAIDQGIRVRFTTADPEEVTQRALDARDELLRMFFAPSYERRARLAAEGADLPKDLISIILTHQEHFGRWDPELTLREVTIFIAGSVGTTVNHSCHTVEELAAWVAQHPEDAAKLTDPKFLSRAFEEELRKWSILPALLRRAFHRVELPSGRVVEANEVVSLRVADASADLIGPDAGSFDPYRELPEGKKRYLLAFGDGAHTCIGKPLVLGEEKRGAGSRVGTVKTILLELYQAGISPDPASPPVFRDDNARGTHLSFPVVFRNL